MCVPYDIGSKRINTKFGNYTLQAFSLPHDNCPNWGCLIRHTNGETILYLNDMEYCEYVFKACKVNHYLIECNYQKEFLDLDAPNKEHKIMGHCSLDTCKEFLKVNYTYDMQNVLLIHGGIGSTNPNECIEEIERALNPNVVVRWAYNETDYDLTDKRLPFTED